MRKDIQIVSGLIVLIALCGCSTASKPKLRLYSQDRPRVDQVQEGNGGYIMGTPKDGEGRPVKDTRRIYVFELTTPPPEIPDVTKTIEESGTTQAVSTSERSRGTETNLPQGTSAAATAPSTITIPSIDTVQPSKPISKSPAGTATVAAPTLDVAEGTQYTIEKDDTLQKISKKFYGTHGKWMKIYEANKDIIKNPDILKPGITIRIPKLQ